MNATADCKMACAHHKHKPIRMVFQVIGMSRKQGRAKSLQAHSTSSSRLPFWSIYLGNLSNHYPPAWHERAIKRRFLRFTTSQRKESAKTATKSHSSHQCTVEELTLDDFLPKPISGLSNVRGGMQVRAHHTHFIILFIEVMQQDVPQRDYSSQFSP